LSPFRKDELSELPSPPAGKSGWPWTEPSPQVIQLRDAEQWPRVTVVTPSFNQAIFLEKTIRSVLLQRYPNLEYIVMDGGSTDGSVDIIKKYEKHLAFWTSQRDAGAADAICKGFDRASGSILAYLNSDDLYLPGAIHELVQRLHLTRSDVVYGNTYWIDEADQTLAERRQTPFSRLAYLYGGADLQQPATIWTTDIYRTAGGMDRSFQCAFDTDMFARFAARHAKFSHIRRFVACARVQHAQKTELLFDTCRKETDSIRARYVSVPVRSMAGSVLRNIGRLQRLICYLIQGDALWLVGRIPDRFRARTGGGTATGPKSKWI
jgi:glycosyltransferase involved in cell wall biosynthesis